MAGIVTGAISAIGIRTVYTLLVLSYFMRAGFAEYFMFVLYCGSYVR